MKSFDFGFEDSEVQASYGMLTWTQFKWESNAFVSLIHTA